MDKNEMTFRCNTQNFDECIKINCMIICKPHKKLQKQVKTKNYELGRGFFDVREQKFL
jgi:hypothetical protein